MIDPFFSVALDASSSSFCLWGAVPQGSVSFGGLSHPWRLTSLLMIFLCVIWSSHKIARLIYLNVSTAIYSFHPKFNISFPRESLIFPLVPEISSSQFPFPSSVTPLFFLVTQTWKLWRIYDLLFSDLGFNSTSSMYQLCGLEQVIQPDNHSAYQLTHVK